MRVIDCEDSYFCFYANNRNYINNKIIRITIECGGRFSPIQKKVEKRNKSKFQKFKWKKFN